MMMSSAVFRRLLEMVFHHNENAKMPVTFKRYEIHSQLALFNDLSLKSDNFSRITPYNARNTRKLIKT